MDAAAAGHAAVAPHPPLRGTFSPQAGRRTLNIKSRRAARRERTLEIDSPPEAGRRTLNIKSRRAARRERTLDIESPSPREAGEDTQYQEPSPRERAED